MNKEKAAAAIADKVNQAEKLISEAEKLADEHGLEFDFSPAYGMGGEYIGKGSPRLASGWNEQGWNPSSQSC